MADYCAQKALWYGSAMYCDLCHKEIEVDTVWMLWPPDSQSVHFCSSACLIRSMVWDKKLAALLVARLVKTEAGK